MAVKMITVKVPDTPPTTRSMLLVARHALQKAIEIGEVDGGELADLREAINRLLALGGQ